MSVASLPASSVQFKAGWILLLGSAALVFVAHLGLVFVLDEPVLFIGYAIFNLYALIVVLIPFRHGEKWGWAVTWLLPIGLAVPAAFDLDILPYYLGVAAICVLGLVLTVRPVFSAGTAGVKQNLVRTPSTGRR